MKLTTACFSALLFAVAQGNQNLVSAHETLANKVVVITGASSGFGKGVALKMSSQGAHVVLAARRTTLLDSLAKECGHDALAVTTDVSKPEDVQNLADQTIKKFGHIDIWINDAGVGAFGPFEEIPIEDHARLIDVNLKGVIYGSHAAMKLFRKQEYGALINLGSTESELPLAYHASYAASKAAVLSLDHALSQEIRLSKNNKIKVCTIMPFAVDTPWWDHAANYSGGVPSMAGLDAPDIVVQAIVKTALHPKKDVHVGLKSKASHKAHSLIPELTERKAANVIHHEIEFAPATTSTKGSLFEPMPEGTDVNGEVRERMKKQKLQRNVEL